MTDYSTDHYESGGEYTDGEYGDGSGYHTPWQEFWDEQAQAKYWYNAQTVRSKVKRIRAKRSKVFILS